MAHNIADMDVFKKVYNLEFIEKKIILLKPMVEDDCTKEEIEQLINSEEFVSFTKDLKKMCMYCVLLNPYYEAGTTSVSDLFKQMVQNIAQIYSTMKELRKSILTHELDTKYEKVGGLLSTLKNLKTDSMDMKKLKQKFESVTDEYYNNNVKNDTLLDWQTHLFDIQTCFYEMFGLIKIKKQDIQTMLEVDLEKFSPEKSYHTL